MKNEPAVVINDLSYSFGDKTAVDRVSFTVQPGDIFGLLGPNGAGKTTTIRSIVTILKPDSGSVRVFGEDSAKSSVNVRRTIGYVPQALSADSGLTGYENVSLFARLFDIPRKERDHRVREVLSAMDLDEAADQMVTTYSGGMIRRLELAQALINKPRLLVLDEPTIGLDPIAREALWTHVRKLRDNHGVTVLLTTHYMEEADQLCDNIALLHKGKLQAIGTSSALKQQVGEGASLEDVFRHYAGSQLTDDGGDARNVRSTRRTARRLG